MGLLSDLSKAVAGPAAAKGYVIDYPWTQSIPTSFWRDSLVDLDTAVGLPAWLSVIRRLAHAAVVTPLMVYEGKRQDRNRAEDSPQWKLLHDAPGPGEGYTARLFAADAVASLAADGNVFIRKFKSKGGQVGELLILDPRDVTVERRGGSLVYLDRSSAGGAVARTASEIIHVRDFNFGFRSSGQAGLRGMSPIATLRSTITTGSRRMDFEESYYRNDSRPGVVLTFDQDVPRERAKETLELWNESHQGTKNAGKASVLGGGASIEVIPPISLSDAEFVEGTRLELQRIAGLYGVPASILGDVTASKSSNAEQDAIYFVSYGIGPLLILIEQALSADRDLFPRDSGLWAEFYDEALVRPDAATRARVWGELRQRGMATANEGRPEFGLPGNHPDGDELQITPVGGAPNAPPAGGAEPEEGPDDE